MKNMGEAIKEEKNKIILYILVLIIIIGPILVIKMDILKNIVIYLFDDKENAYQYMQYIGGILGVVLSVLGAIYTINYQTLKEGYNQKVIARKTYVRENLIIKISGIKVCSNYIINKIKTIPYLLDLNKKLDYELIQKRKDYFKEERKIYKEFSEEFDKEYTIMSNYMEEVYEEIKEYEKGITHIKELLDEFSIIITLIDINFYCELELEVVNLKDEDIKNDCDEAIKIYEELKVISNNLIKKLNEYYFDNES